MESKSDNARREDANYRLSTTSSSPIWLLEEKRTGHIITFTDVQPNGFKNSVFLRRLSPYERQNDQTASSGNRVAILNKEKLPHWLIEEFEHINETGGARPPTDPRQENEYGRG